MDSSLTFLDQFNSHFVRINAELKKGLKSHVSLIEEIGNHSLLGEGKRLRPLLFVLSSRLCGYQGDDTYYLSTVFEYIHAASLLHDDVLDNAEIRRKKPSANHMWGNPAAVLCGDFIYSKSLDMAVSGKNLKFLKVLTGTTTRMAEGQILELVHTHDWYLSRDEYMEIIISKTAALISAACACGGIISGAEKVVVDHLGQFGLNLGIAFQLIDDLLDYTSSREVFGKPVGKDLLEGKITLPLIYTLADLEKGEVERLRDLFKGRKADDEDFRELQSLIRRNGVIERIRAEAKAYMDKAARSLSQLPDSPVRKILMEINSHLIQRNF